jgi:hypothetical protein
VQRAGERDFTLRPATKSADIALDGGTTSPRAALSADFAQYWFRHSLPSIIGSSPMQRVDLYIKVTVDLDEDEKPERVAGEICRQLEKLYVVRSAELSNTVARE